MIGQFIIIAKSSVFVIPVIQTSSFHSIISFYTQLLETLFHDSLIQIQLYLSFCQKHL